MSEIKQNMLRERADKLPPVTDEMLKEILPHHLELYESFFTNNVHLSPQSKKQYRSGIKQWFWWVHIKLKDKPMWRINKKDFLKYRNFLYNHGLSSKSLSFKQCSVSTLCNFIEIFYIEDDVDEDDENFELYTNYQNFRNFTRNLPSLPTNTVYEKIKVTKDEYDFLMTELESRKDYLGMAWLATAFNAGARRAEIPQFKTEILSYPIEEDKNYILSHNIRLKGSGEAGKVEKYMINFEAIKYMKLWVEKRGYESEFIFTTKSGKRVNSEWANYLCKNVLSYLLDRRINCHIFKASCVTYLLEQGVELKLVSEFIAHHNDVSTTLSFYDLRDFEEERNKIF